MRSLPSLFVLFSVVWAHTSKAQDQSAIGQWRDHFPYTNLVAVAEGGGHAYAASTTGLFRYDPSTGEIDRLNKTNALSDVGISGLAWNEPLQALLVYYTNGNLDLIEGSRSTNIGDIKRSSIIGNKGVYSVYMVGTTAYLGCGFGIVVLDLQNKEVRETWFIGPSGSQVRVNGLTMSPDSIYAATGTGLFTASRTAANLASFDSWRKRTDMGASLSNGNYNTVAWFGDRLFLNAKRPGDGGDSLIVLGTDNTWSRFQPLFGLRNSYLSVSADQEILVVTHDNSVHAYNLALDEITLIYAYEGVSAAPSQAIRSVLGITWVADRFKGLVRSGGGDVGTSILPNGPRTATSWRLATGGGAMYVATGAVTGTWNNQYLKDGIHSFIDGRWSTIDRSEFPLMDGANVYAGSMNDMVAIEVDPDDPHHAWAGSWDDGLLEVRNGAPVQIYNNANSALGLDINGFEGRLYVGGIRHDRQGNLWMSNPWSERPIVVRTKSGEWHNFSPGPMLNGNLLISDVVVGRNGYKWFIRPRGNGLLVYDSGNSISATDDDQYKLLNNQTGTGGLPSPDVYSIAEDLDQQIWVGTARGVAVYYSPEAVFNSDDYDAQQILIEQDGNVQILLETEAVNSIAIDGANRKWIGTQSSGVYLISADGREEIQHFTAENSPLPSNTITNIVVDGTYGEVYMSTDQGIMSYRSDATEGADENTCAQVFPNPVRENYFGPIAINGLVRNSEVKITDISGNLVYRTTSEGGQAIWYGNDMSGNRVATGVYLVLVSDQSGEFKCNTKVLLVR
ncbi:MAG: T9SS type A sorting domain-containing protein [Flavobacteriales bacterium]